MSATFPTQLLQEWANGLPRLPDKPRWQNWRGRVLSNRSPEQAQQAQDVRRSGTFGLY